MSVEDIASYLKEKTSKMKKSGGGEEHKKQTGFAKFLPACLVSVLIELTSFFTYKLGISVDSMKIKKRQFGAAYVTSLGSLGFEDAVAPFTGFLNAPILLAANATSKQPVVEGDKVVVGDVMNCNFIVDHRYIDGGNCSKLTSIFKSVFEEPEKYIKNANKEMKKEE